MDQGRSCEVKTGIGLCATFEREILDECVWAGELRSNRGI
jgi:hypothetical protein